MPDSKSIRRQHPVDRFILDFYCHAAQLAIEVDGPYHLTQIAYDQARTEIIATHGIQVIRFTNHQVLTDRPTVLNAIATIAQTRIQNIQ